MGQPSVSREGRTVDQPETPGRIARVVPAEVGRYWVGVRVESADRSGKRPAEQERPGVANFPVAGGRPAPS